MFIQLRNIKKACERNSQAFNFNNNFFNQLKIKGQLTNQTMSILII